LLPEVYIVQAVRGATQHNRYSTISNLYSASKSFLLVLQYRPPYLFQCSTNSDFRPHVNILLLQPKHLIVQALVALDSARIFRIEDSGIQREAKPLRSPFPENLPTLLDSLLTVLVTDFSITLFIARDLTLSTDANIAL